MTACVGAGGGGYTALDMAADDVAPFTAAASGRWASEFTQSLTICRCPALRSGPRRGGVAMDVDTNQPLGTPTWIDLGVPDLDRALEFYGAVFGWDFDVGPEEFGRYTTCLLRGRRVAALAVAARAVA